MKMKSREGPKIHLSVEGGRDTDMGRARARARVRICSVCMRETI